MRKQVFVNGDLRSKNILPIKSEKQKLIERLERTNSCLDFYKHKTKILKHLRGTRE